MTLDELLLLDEEHLDQKLLKEPLPYMRGKTTAHLLAENGYRFKNREVLKIADQDGWTVAHEMAYRGHVFDPIRDESILRLASVEGITVAHVQAFKGYVFDAKKHLSLLRLSDRDGWTVAHEMAYQGYRFSPGRHWRILRLATREGWTVAHEMARQGFVFDPVKHKNLLTLSNDKDYTVAHEMARQGWMFNPQKHWHILSGKGRLANSLVGINVLECFFYYNREKILTGKYDKVFLQNRSLLNAYIHVLENHQDFGLWKSYMDIKAYLLRMSIQMVQEDIGVTFVRL